MSTHDEPFKLIFFLSPGSIDIVIYKTRFPVNIISKTKQKSSDLMRGNNTIASDLVSHSH